MIDQPPGSPLCGKYLVRNRVANRLLRVTDWTLTCCRPLMQLVQAWHAPRCSEGSAVEPRPSEYLRACHPAVPEPRRILLANGAHFGDVFLSLSLLPALRSAFPGARIGFLCGTWARRLLERHPRVAWLHHVDHWKLNRSDLPLLEKLRHYQRTRRQALREIRRKRYDVAIDLYYYFPSSIPLLWQAGIPCRIGYTSGGFGPLLSHGLDWTPADRHVTDYQADLLRVVGVSERHLEKMDAPLVPEEQNLPRDVVDELRRIGVPPRGFVVFHMGTAAAVKEWPSEQWRQLARHITADGHALVFTGTAGRERRHSEQVGVGLAACVNLCGRLAWNELISLIRPAQLLVGVDSVAGHVAAAVGTPCITIASGITHHGHWRPRGAFGRVLSHPVPCAPCYRGRGCQGMECVRGVSVQQVYDAIHDLLRNRQQRGA
jgi:ADP-heptose:LPS heptosyltransferase